MFELQPEMKRPMKIMLISLGIFFGVIFLYKFIGHMMMKHFIATSEQPAVTVSAMKVGLESWQPKLKASGGLRATKGVNVTAQVSGMIQTIYFTPGAMVEEGTPLVQQNADPDNAQLHALQASAELARITFERDKAQYKIHAVSKQQLDSDEQNLKNLRAQVEQQKANAVMKTIKAPFSGRLGVSKVNPGQFLNPGDVVVMLQTLDPIYADFYMPQQTLAQLKVGQTVSVVTNTFPDKVFTGQITTIDPGVDTSNRNVLVEATIANPHGELAPGMYTSVEVDAGAPQPYLTLPQTAISFNSFGDIVYIIKESGKKDKDGKPELIAKQSFVTTGDVRGDQITVLTGLRSGDMVVTSGQLKLKNGSVVVINNTVQPSNNPNPTVSDEHESDAR
jgi:membrane fusion protein (multidrug efflux system)